MASIKKVGSYKGIPLVEGDENEVRKGTLYIKNNTEGITVNKREGKNLKPVTSSASGGTSFKYYILKEEYRMLAASAILNSIITLVADEEIGEMIMYNALGIGKTTSSETPSYANCNIYLMSSNRIYGFFLPTTSIFLKERGGDIVTVSLELDLSKSDYWREGTEEEYYNLINEM